MKNRPTKSTPRTGRLKSPTVIQGPDEITGGGVPPELVSVIVPAFNASTFIEDCLRSALRQTYSAIEIIVVDDGSTDNTADLVEALASQDSRIRLVCQANGGVGSARNLAIQVARGVYIAPLDADDLWHPEKIARQVQTIQQGGPTMGAVYCWDTKIDARGDLLRFGKKEYLIGHVSRALTLINFTGHASVPLLRTRALSDIGGYLDRTQQHGAQGCEDWDLMIRVAERYQIGLVPEYLVSYRQLAGSMSVDAPAMECSFDVLMQRVRDRNPSLPHCLVRWSAGNFYRYLYFRCLHRSNYGQCLRYLAKTTWVDPTIWLSVRSYQILLVALARILLGHGFLQKNVSERTAARTPDHIPQVPRGQRWFARIQERRWAFASQGSSSRTSPVFSPVHLDVASRQS